MNDRKLVRFVAEKCMGWKWNRDSPWVNHPDRDERFDPRGAWELDGQYGAGDHWNPLTSISDAFMLVDRMRELGWWMEFSCGHGIVSNCRFNRGSERGIVQVGTTDCRAITLAVVAALEAGK